MRARDALIAAGVFAALSLLWTRPLPWSIGDVLPYDSRFADPSSARANVWVWDFWWVRTALAEGRTPFFCDRVFWPDGAPLGAHPLALHHGAIPSARS